MRRRDFIAGLGGAVAAWPLAVRAQQRVPRVGVLIPLSSDDPDLKARVAAFDDELKRRGWSQGQNIRIDYRFEKDTSPERQRAAAAELITAGPDVIFAFGVSVWALRDRTQTTPIVFAEIAAPVERGLVASLARPGENVTGFTNFVPSLAGKWLGLLKELKPELSRAALTFNPDVAPHAPYFLRAVEAASRTLGVQTISAPVRTDAEVEAALSSLGQQGGALLVLPDPFTFSHRQAIIRAAESHRVPAIYPYRVFAEDGGLMVYDDDIMQQFRGAADYVDRILKGAKPAELPVQEPTKYELIINLKAAKAIGVAIPFSMQLLADEVIE